MIPRDLDRVSDRVDPLAPAPTVDHQREHSVRRERAAEALDISATTLWRKMTRLSITYDSR